MAVVHTVGNTTRVYPHTCVSAFQDVTYGKGNRLWNKRQGAGKPGWTCTVCGHQTSEATKATVVEPMKK